MVQQHPEAHRYRVAVKGNRIEVYEQVGPDYNEMVRKLHIPGLLRPGLAEELRDLGSGMRSTRLRCASPSWIPYSGGSAQSGCATWGV